MCIRDRAAGGHAGHIIFSHFRAPFEGGQGSGGTVGDDVTPQTIHIELAADGGDAQAQIFINSHLVDVLLDSAASGWNTVEREGVSVRHPARFVLIGSGNPEEGELRPQLLDRFGMSVEVRTVRNPELRVQVVDQRTAFDSDPDGFSTAVEGNQNALQQRVCLLYTSPSPRDRTRSRMPSSA